MGPKKIDSVEVVQSGGEFLHRAPQIHCRLTTDSPQTRRVRRREECTSEQILTPCLVAVPAPGPAAAAAALLLLLLLQRLLLLQQLRCCETPAESRATPCLTVYAHHNQLARSTHCESITSLR